MSIELNSTDATVNSGEKPVTIPASQTVPASDSGAAPETGRRGKFVPLPRRNLPPKPVSNRMFWHIFVLATGLVILLFTLVIKVVLPARDARSPSLGEEFNLRRDNFAIRPPLNWAIKDRESETSLVMLPKSGKYKGYPPLITVNRDNGGGRFSSYLEEHKNRIAFQSKGVKWLGESEDWIDGCHAARLLYEWDSEQNDGSPGKVRTMQYILDDRLRYYRITCAAGADDFDEYLPRFEASARSFRRTPIPVQQPQIVPLQLSQ